MADEMELRVSTTEKESVARRLGTAMAEGRLTLVEYEDRVGQVWASSTRGELAKVTEDLPDTTTAPTNTQWREYLDEWKEWIGTAILLTGIWGITSITSGELNYYWPVWPLGIWGLILVASIFWGDDEDDKSDREVAAYWFSPDEPASNVSDPAMDLRSRNRIALSYRRSGESSATSRVVDPYGLVAEAGRW